MPIEVPMAAAQRELRARLGWTRGKTVSRVRNAWDALGYGDVTFIDSTTGDELTDDAEHDAWYVCRWGGPVTGPCEAVADPFDATFYAQPTPCRPPRVSGVEWEYVACPTCDRLYLSDHQASDGDTAASLAAPNLGTGSLLAGWGTWGTFGTNMLYPVAAASTSGGPGAPNWAAVNAGQQFVAIVAGTIRLGDATGLLEKVQGGGTVKAQFRCSARHGIGISEAAQNHLAAISMQVYRPSTSSMVGTALDVTRTGDLKFPAQSTYVNRSWKSYAYSGVADADEDDYLWVCLGVEHLGPTSGGTGAGIRFIDHEATDLPEDQSTTDDINSWIEVCG